MNKKLTLIIGKKNLSPKAYGIIAIVIGLLGYGLYHWVQSPTLSKPTHHLANNYADAYKATLTLKDGSTIVMQPVRNTAEDFQNLSKVYTEPTCATMMTNGQPWAEKSIKGNQMFYTLSWELFHDLQRSGVKSPQPMTLAFLVFDDKGTLLGDMGLQQEKDRLDEVFFNVMPSARRKGVGYIGGRHLIELYEKYFPGKALGANILPHNMPSQKLMTKLGFTRKKDKSGTQEIVHMYGRIYELWERRATPQEQKA